MPLEHSLLLLMADWRASASKDHRREERVLDDLIERIREKQLDPNLIPLEKSLGISTSRESTIRYSPEPPNQQRQN